MKFTDAVGELKSLLSKPEVPPEVIDCALCFLQSPHQSLLMKPDVRFAMSAPGAAVTLEASDRLLDLLAAARAAKWEDIIVGKFERLRHEQSPEGKVP